MGKIVTPFIVDHDPVKIGRDPSIHK
ncbi:uncharacterized protein G2W53_008035 [Senna tora]|uniref:Uncharacterized protein n=1 Tax=Senna tora TaxID=362788 RepID=A0A834X7U9_9FABA|nr:uncharacterized protein G2W53_008035 [Senna tora]